MKRSTLERLERLETSHNEMGRMWTYAAERKIAHEKMLVLLGECLEKFKTKPPGPKLSIEEELALLERLRRPIQLPPSMDVYPRTRRR